MSRIEVASHESAFAVDDIVTGALADRCARNYPDNLVTDKTYGNPL